MSNTRKTNDQQGRAAIRIDPVHSTMWHYHHDDEGDSHAHVVIEITAVNGKRYELDMHEDDAIAVAENIADRYSG